MYQYLPLLSIVGLAIVISMTFLNVLGSASRKLGRGCLFTLWKVIYDWVILFQHNWKNIPNYIIEIYLRYFPLPCVIARRHLVFCRQGRCTLIELWRLLQCSAIISRRVQSLMVTFQWIVRVIPKWDTTGWWSSKSDRKICRPHGLVGFISVEQNCPGASKLRRYGQDSFRLSGLEGHIQEWCCSTCFFSVGI